MSWKSSQTNRALLLQLRAFRSSLASLRPAHIKQGQEAQLWVDTSQLHLFDHETGRSLLTRESSGPEVPESSTASRRRLIA